MSDVPRDLPAEPREPGVPRTTEARRAGWTTGDARPFSTAPRQAGVEQAISVMAARGEPTLVLCTGDRTGKGAMRLLPALPEACFVEVGEHTGAALRRAVEHGITRVVFVGMIGKLTELAAGGPTVHPTPSKVPTDLLGEITTAMGGPPELAGEVARADTAGHAYEIWETAGSLGPCARELCRRVAGVLERFAAGEPAASPGADASGWARGGGPIAAQVVLVDFTGERMVGMYGRLHARR